MPVERPPKSRLAALFAALTIIVISATIADAAPPRRQGRTKPLPIDPKLFEGNPPKHTGDYPSFKIAWQPEPRLRDVTAVFPHPLNSRRILVATSAGLILSDDTGKSWNPIPGTADISAIRHVEFAPASADIYLATEEKGVWHIADIAKPPVQIGSSEKGLISNAVTQVRVDTADPTFKTLVAVHGSAGGGISQSRDAGRTWKPLPGLDNYFIEKILPGGPGVPWAFAMASLNDPSGIRGVYYCHAIGDFMKQYASDIQANDGALEILFKKPFSEGSDLSFWATNSSGIVRTEHEGTNAQRIGSEESGGADKWSSIGTTWGATADSKIIYGYAPQKLGFAFSEDDGATFTAMSDGLPTGGFVRQGAHVRANAGGTVFFAAINRALYVGTRYTGNLVISDIKVTPEFISYAPIHFTTAFNQFRTQLEAFRNRRPEPSGPVETLEKTKALAAYVSAPVFFVSARVAGRQDDPAAGPARVTVDLSRVGGSATALMFDDGMHGDAEAGDGIYGASCYFRPDRMRNLVQDRRRPTPGPMALTITAASADGSLSSAIGVIGLFERPESHTWYSPSGREQWKDTEGGVTVALEDPKTGADRRANRITTKDKPWSVPLTAHYAPGAMGYSALSFYVKADKPLAELYVQLQDFSPDTVAARGVRVPVVKEKLVEGGSIDKTYRRVVVPFSMLLKDNPDGPRFRPQMLRSLVISGDAGPPQQVWISAIRFHAGGDEKKTPADKETAE